MKKIIVFMMIAMVSLQVHAERRFVLVDIYHISEKNFYRNGNYLEYYITKPNCEAGGVPEIDKDTFHVFPTIGTRFYLGRVADAGKSWRLYFDPGMNGQTYNFTAKVYCSYPIQCIKQ